MVVRLPAAWDLLAKAWAPLPALQGHRMREREGERERERVLTVCAASGRSPNDYNFSKAPFGGDSGGLRLLELLEIH